MSMKNQVIWHEGLFIKPQHFQQQQRYTGHLIQQRINACGHYFYGLSSLSINEEYLNFGRILLTEASGVMPDGTVFSIPAEDLLPEPLDVTEKDPAQKILLAIPVAGNNSVSELSRDGQHVKSRLLSRHVDVRDLHSEGGDVVSVETGSIHSMLILENNTDKRAYSTLPVARISQILSGNRIVLDKTFMPCGTRVSVMPTLHGFISELLTIISGRASELESRIGAPGQVTDVSDFLLLQLLNRATMQFRHFSEITSLHPERLYEAMSLFYGELITFVGSPRLPSGEIIPYRHASPDTCFPVLMRYLHQALSVVLTQRAEQIPLSRQQFGVQIATLGDAGLLKTGDFILVVKSAMMENELLARFLGQVKIAASDKIRDLVNLQLAGVPLIHLNTAPRQLPVFSGCLYFRLDRRSDKWPDIINAKSLAFHVAGEFPDLNMQLWVIRSQ